MPTTFVTGNAYVFLARGKIYCGRIVRAHKRTLVLRNFKTRRVNRIDLATVTAAVGVSVTPA